MSWTWLPAFNATMNATSAALVSTGYLFIRRGRVAAHRACMIAALAASTLFLAGYLTHHARVGSMPFRGTGMVRVVYFSILLTHTILAVVILPLIAVTVVRAARGEFDAHARIARITLPLWLYVSVTGVVVYWMLYQARYP
jgi:uncharacterized membrane protein YozB (DUF420 family)